MITNFNSSCIISLATPNGIGALSIIRLSGYDSISICNNFFFGKDLNDQLTHTIHFGVFKNESVIDEVLVSIFRAPHSFTKENSVEISCHASTFIINKIIEAFINVGVRLAKPGEFTQRAFLNGRFDLTQAEAVADLIASDNKTSHQISLNQMRGGFSNQIKILREKLISFASLIELELDFGEEDVEFANRKDLQDLVNEIQLQINILLKSFKSGNVIKNGVPVVIAGKPNAGKSTLLNSLLNEEKAIVSEIAGTTRDLIEDTINIDGINFRFIDTAGLRETNDQIEMIGVSRALDKIKQATFILYLTDLTVTDQNEIDLVKKDFTDLNGQLIFIFNKIDLVQPEKLEQFKINFPTGIFISAHYKTGVEALKSFLISEIRKDLSAIGDVIISNSRHYESLLNTNKSLDNVLSGILNGITGDIIAMDIRHALYELGLITGEITNEDLLDNIFSKFCIGK